jgi:hypothetical protein
MVGPTPSMLSAEQGGVGDEGGDQSEDGHPRKLPQGHALLLAAGWPAAFERPFVRDWRRTANPSALLPVY